MVLLILRGVAKSGMKCAVRSEILQNTEIERKEGRFLMKKALVYGLLASLFLPLLLYLTEV